MPGRERSTVPTGQGLYRRAIRLLSSTVPVARVPFLRGQAVALGCVLAAILVRLALDPVVAGLPYATFFPAILVASIWGGTRAGLTTLVLAWAMTSFLWIDPAGGLAVGGGRGWAAAAFAVFGGTLLVVAAMLRDLVVALRRSEEQARILAGEMEHRIENLVATATALARHTARSASSTEEHVRLFEARMGALGHARRLALAAPGGAADLRALAGGVLAPFDLARFDLSGPEARVPESLATMVALALHELATNALKYGALSQAGGRVVVGWSRCDRGIELNWRESGGPPVAEPTRTGFGTRMIRGALASHGAETEVSFAPDGLRVRLLLPEAPKPRAAGTSAGAAPLLPANGATR